MELKSSSPFINFLFILQLPYRRINRRRTHRIFRIALFVFNFELSSTQIHFYCFKSCMNLAISSLLLMSVGNFGPDMPSDKNHELSKENYKRIKYFDHPSTYISEREIKVHFIDSRIRDLVVSIEGY